MVRRWSHINKSNFLSNDRYNLLLFYYHEEYIREGTYLRTSQSFLTLFRRKVTVFRKRINNWVIYFSFLAFWANNYLNLKKHLKYVYNFRIFKYNYITPHLKHINKFTKNVNFFNNFVFTSIHYKFFFFMRKKSQIRSCKDLLKIIYNKVNYISSPINLEVRNQTLFYQLVGVRTFTNLLKKRTLALTQIYLFFFNTLLKQLIELYKINVLFVLRLL